MSSDEEDEEEQEEEDDAMDVDDYLNDESMYEEVRGSSSRKRSNDSDGEEHEKKCMSVYTYDGNLKDNMVF